MQIAFDAKRAVQNMTGLGNYSRYVLDILSDYYPQNRYLLYAPHKRDNYKLNALLSWDTNIEMHYPEGVWRFFPSLWRTFGIPKDLPTTEPLIFHGLSNELPLNIGRFTNIKTVVTLHALIFSRLPHCYPLADRLIYN